MSLPSAEVVYNGLCNAIMANLVNYEGSWAPTVWNYLWSLGEAEGLECQVGPTKADCPQSSGWLWDFLLTRGKPSGEDFRHVALACEYECQRDLNAIRYDFRKLLVAKSPRLVFVGFAGTTYNRSVRPRLEAMEHDVERCPLDDGQELLAVITQEPGAEATSLLGTAHGLVFARGKKTVRFKTPLVPHQRTPTHVA